MSRSVRDAMTDEPVALPADATALDAARLMRGRSIGTVLVTDSDGCLCGIVTDRDVAVRVVAERLDPETTELGAIASKGIAHVSPDEPLDAALERMRGRAVRRVPVVEDGRPVGMLSLGDAAEHADIEATVEVISAAPPNA